MVLNSEKNYNKYKPNNSIIYDQRTSFVMELFDEVYVPKAVIKELTESAHEFDHGRQEIIEAIKSENIIPYTIQDELMIQRLYGKLHVGELETWRLLLVEKS